MKLGAKVVYGKGENIHVSGHGFQEDQKLMLALAKPKFFVPVHGEHRMLVCHSRSAQIMGVPKDNILIIENGDVVELTPNSIQKGDPVKAGVELLDNSRNGIVDARVLKERQQLAGDGVVTVLAPISTDGKMVAPPRVNLRGVVTTAEPRKMSMWTEREISWVLENRWKQLSRQTGPNNFEVDWIGVQREIENGLSRRMRRELQVEPLILCLVQPAPSGTRAYIPKIIEEQNFSNRNRNNNNFHKKSNNNHPNSSNNPQNTQKSAKVSQNPSAETATEDSFEGRTRRRRSAVTS
jgi:ribonuclease J